MDSRYPDANSPYPIPNMRQMTQIRPTITRDNIIVGDYPARLIRNRFDEELTALLQAWQWWDLPYEEVANLIPLLHSADLAFVKKSIKALMSE